MGYNGACTVFITLGLPIILEQCVVYSSIGNKWLNWPCWDCDWLPSAQPSGTTPRLQFDGVIFRVRETENWPDVTQTELTWSRYVLLSRFSSWPSYSIYLLASLLSPQNAQATMMLKFAIYLRVLKMKEGAIDSKQFAILVLVFVGISETWSFIYHS